MNINWRSWDLEPLFLLRQQFLEDVPGDTLSADLEFGLDQSGIEFIDIVTEAIGDQVGSSHPVLVKSFAPLHHVAMVDGLLSAHVVFGNSKTDLTEKARGYFTVYIAGQRELVLGLRKALRAKFGAGKLPTVTWQFARSDSISSRHIVMERPKPVYDEFYPFLNERVEQFIDRYLEDSASILFLAGEPGTGKTSLIRHMIYSRALTATITFDAALLEKDGMFVDFLCGDDDGVLLIEDADTMLGSRESEGNKLISRFLNISDGLIKMHRKKIVFTTNMSDFSRVDPALTREGRCFGALMFRPLTAVEAAAAAKVAGLSAPGEEVTLAQLFNPSRDKRPEIRAIGF